MAIIIALLSLWQPTLTCLFWYAVSGVGRGRHRVDPRHRFRGRRADRAAPLDPEPGLFDRRRCGERGCPPAAVVLHAVHSPKRKEGPSPLGDGPSFFLAGWTPRRAAAAGSRPRWPSPVRKTPSPGPVEPPPPMRTPRKRWYRPTLYRPCPIPDISYPKKMRAGVAQVIARLLSLPS